MGDGNHSLATAKACYEEQKKGKTPEEYLALPSRFALVEVVNNHDDALQFEPIHRVLFGVDHKKFMDAFRAAYPNAYEGKGDGHTIEFVWNGESHFITVPDPKVQLAVGTLQNVIDPYLKANGGEVDYIHGDDVTPRAGRQARQHGLPAARHGQGAAVQDRHGRRCAAPQDLLHGPRSGQALLHRSPQDREVTPAKKRPSGAFLSGGTMEPLTLYAPAKVNLTLTVGDRRPDGYHDVSTVMQAVGLYDTLILTHGGAGLTLTCTDPAVPSDATNLVLRAARQVFRRDEAARAGPAPAPPEAHPVPGGTGRRQQRRCIHTAGPAHPVRAVPAGRASWSTWLRRWEATCHSSSAAAPRWPGAGESA